MIKCNILIFNSNNLQIRHFAPFYTRLIIFYLIFKSIIFESNNFSLPGLSGGHLSNLPTFHLSNLPLKG
ncbi:MAG: hypothetical protein B6D64_14345 [Bacteroidetes bacterium 4484_276]|nr:MAG: hypothetical protein B6D64_14345 [Bacteroidetes bacterium 4484_276]